MPSGGKYRECVYSDNVEVRLVSEVASHDEDKIVTAMRLVSNMRPFETEIG